MNFNESGYKPKKNKITLVFFWAGLLPTLRSVHPYQTYKRLCHVFPHPSIFPHTILHFGKSSSRLHFFFLLHSFRDRHIHWAICTLRIRVFSCRAIPLRTFPRFTTIKFRNRSFCCTWNGRRRFCLFMSERLCHGACCSGITRCIGFHLDTLLILYRLEGCFSIGLSTCIRWYRSIYHVRLLRYF